MKIYWYVLLVLILAAQTAIAEDKGPCDPNEVLLTKWGKVITESKDPNKMMESIRDATVEILLNKKLSKKAKGDVIDRLVSPVFEFPLMGKLSLGREHWPKLTDPQREKFTALFVKRLKSLYREKIMLFSDQKILLKPPVKKKETVHIAMDLITDDSKITILYKLHKVDKYWRIYDVEIQGVSIILTYRSQFNDVLINGTVEDLLAQLEKPPTS